MRTDMKRFTFFGLAAACLFFSMSVPASVVIEGSRVIYNQSNKEVTVKVVNEGIQPSVVQAWIDGGDISKNPSLIKVPFLLTPPMSRIDPAKGQVLRLIYTGEPLPSDRESIFYLNVLDIPPKAKNIEDKNVVQLAIRTRIKLFFRPDKLPGAADKAPAEVKWSIVQSNGTWKLNGENQSAFHVSMLNIVITSPHGDVKVGDGMVAPGEHKVFDLVVGPPVDAQVKFSFIDDFGAARELTSALIKH